VWFLAVVMLMSIQAEGPPVLLVHREAPTPGNEAAYDAIETDTARICRELGCPHPYVAIEALSRPAAVWFINRFDSTAHHERVVKAYAANDALMVKLRQNSTRKAVLVGPTSSVTVIHRADLDRGTPWRPGIGRFLAITVTRRAQLPAGTVFDAPDGERLAIVSANSLADAERAANAAGTDSRVFAVRPSWSFPDPSWTAADPSLWKSAPRPEA
jgi:hypothetical protein